MVRRLIIMRHAKSDPAGKSLPDHERPLALQGRIDAPNIARKILGLGLKPELVLCSDAQRTLETWAILAEIFGQGCSMKPCSSLYSSGVNTYLNEIIKEGFQGNTLMLLGHNPTIEDLVAQLADQKLVINPANAVILETEFDDWREAIEQRGGWKLVSVIAC